LITNAKFSDDRRYRYWLLRSTGIRDREYRAGSSMPGRNEQWEFYDSGFRDFGTLAIIGLNPSTADETQNDPTVSRCISWARRLGFGRLLMLNMYAFRATYPRDLWRAESGLKIDIITTPNSAAALLQYCSQFNASRIIAAWGKGTPRHALYANAHQGRAKILADAGWRLDCFRKNLDGSPAHPLYLPYSLTPKPWNYPEAKC